MHRYSIEHILRSTSLLLLLVLLIPAPVAIAKDPGQPARFGIGDVPPRFEPMAWIKGEPVPAFAPGRVHVVNFFATWCGASRQSMVLMTRLAGEHAADLTVVGVNVREAERGTPTVEAVSGFVAEHPQYFGYPVAMDAPDDAPLFRRWMRGSGMYATPTAFIVGRNGRVAWIGIPVDDRSTYPFEEALVDVLQGAVNQARAREAHADLEREMVQYLQDREVLADMYAASERGDHHATLAAAEKVIAAQPEYRQRTLYTRMSAQLHLDESDALTLAEQELATLFDGGNDEQVNRIAGSIGRVFASHPGLSATAQARAMDYLQRGLRTDPDGFGGVLNWLAIAELEFARGNLQFAVDAQRHAVRLAQTTPQVTPDMLAQLEQELASYEAALVMTR